MPSDFDLRLNAFAEVVVRIGLNLQPSQKLLIAEPYVLQGVDRDAASLVEAVTAAAGRAGCSPSSVETIWGEAARLRELAEQQDWKAFSELAVNNARKMDSFVNRGDALLFLPGGQPQLMAGIAPEWVHRLRQIGWEHFGPVARRLTHGETNWTAAPAPSREWADAVYADLPDAGRLDALWRDVLAAARVPAFETARLSNSAVAEAWHVHLAALGDRRDELNSRRAKTLRYLGEGTDLTVVLPREHLWCTASLVTARGIAFVANVPTEEVFTLPHKNSAEGFVRVARPINYGGGIIDGITLEFRRGQVVKSHARVGQALLQRLLETDEGASRLGEVAIIARNPAAPPDAAAQTTWRDSGRFFHQPLLDENASNHIALGESYDFCLRSPHAYAQNHSLIHVDLPLAAEAHLSP